ncbi:MAG: hypothetical protein WAK26_09480 [Terracidiphilus sp.]
MARFHISFLLCFALVAVQSGLAASVPREHSPVTVVSGVYSVAFHLNMASKLPAGSTIICRAHIAPDQGSPDLMNSPSATFPVAASGLVTVTGSTATCVAEIPFSWTLESARGPFILSYEIEAVSCAGTAPKLLACSARQSAGMALLSAGSRANLYVNLSF